MKFERHPGHRRQLLDEFAGDRVAIEKSGRLAPLSFIDGRAEKMRQRRHGDLPSSRPVYEHVGQLADIAPGLGHLDVLVTAT
jgi:hypothetical protein